ncbi:MAG: RluA family pseudouridine synthase [Verrucomicrobiota bacterium]
MINAYFELGWETEDWIAVVKPPHLLTHPTRPGPETTLWELVQERWPDYELGLINRIDRDTSGLVLLSKHKEATSQLGIMTMNRAIEKRYLALVLGEAPEEQTINAPLGRLCSYADHPIYVEQGVVPQGQKAVTHLCRLEMRFREGQPISLVEVRLETGRLHQIRAHLRHAGFPVVGDKLYGPDRQFYLDCIEDGWTARMESELWIRRQALHATALSFEWSGAEVRLAIPLAADLQEFWMGLDQQ